MWNIKAHSKHQKQQEQATNRNDGINFSYLLVRLLFTSRRLVPHELWGSFQVPFSSPQHPQVYTSPIFVWQQWGGRGNGYIKSGWGLNSDCQLVRCSAGRYWAYNTNLLVGNRKYPNLLHHLLSIGKENIPAKTLTKNWKLYSHK